MLNRIIKLQFFSEHIKVSLMITKKFIPILQMCNSLCNPANIKRWIAFFLL